MELIEDIIEKSVNCKKNCGCIKNGENFCCEVVNCIDDKIHFINYTSDCYCGYKMAFGNADICNCPARKELFNKKGI